MSRCYCLLTRHYRETVETSCGKHFKTHNQPKKSFPDLFHLVHTFGGMTLYVFNEMILYNQTKLWINSLWDVTIGHYSRCRCDLSRKKMRSVQLPLVEWVMCAHFCSCLFGCISVFVCVCVSKMDHWFIMNRDYWNTKQIR